VKKTETKIAFKGFNKDLQCRDFQFEIGKTFVHEGLVKACSSGFHSCENPLDVFSYYAPGDSRFCIVEASGEMSTHSDDSKIASASIHIKAELKIPELVSYGVKWVLDNIKKDAKKTAHQTGDRTHATNTGDQSAATNTGYRSAATNTGYRSAATNTGDQSAATNTGDQSAATNTGYQSAATNTGYRSAATNTGDQSAATNTGYRSAATNTGDQSAATNTGYRSAATNTGYRSAATNTGDQSAATNTGDQSAAEVSGKSCIAIASGYYGRAKANEGSAIVLCRYDSDGNMTHVKSAIAGKDCKADVWYTLGETGELEEVA
jgi:hypothetical protein